MEVLRNLVDGLITVLKITGASMLYRHPHRMSSQSLRSDWVHIGRDIESVIGRLESEADNGQ